MALATKDLKGVEIFATGTHNGQEYTATDLDDMVTAFAALRRDWNYDPPLKLGHDEDQPALEDVPEGSGPALGWVSRLYRQGEKLVADLARVPEKLADLIEAGAYRYRSAEVWFDLKMDDTGEQVYRRALKAVAFLGDTMPAVKNLRDIFKLYRVSGAFAQDAEGRSYQPVLFAVPGESGRGVQALMTAWARWLRGHGAPVQEEEHMAADAPQLEEFACLLFKTEVGYEINGGATGRACGDCRWFQVWPENGSCALVEGRIGRSDVCERFEAMPEEVRRSGMYAQDAHDLGQRSGVAEHAETMMGAWDGAAAVQRIRKWASSDDSGDKDKMDWAKYGRAFAVQGEAGDFAGYAFPHHDVSDGQLMLHRGGVIAAWAAARGGRSGQANEDVQKHMEPHRRMLGMMDDGDKEEKEGKEGTRMSDSTIPAAAVNVQEFEDLKAKLAEAATQMQTFAQENATLKGAVETLSKDLESERTLRLERWATDTVKEWYGDGDGNRARLLKFVRTFGQDSAEVREYIERENAHVAQLRQANLFTEVGRPGQPTNLPASAFEAEVAKLTATGKTRVDAIAQVAREKAHLYRQHTAQVTGAQVTY